MELNSDQLDALTEIMNIGVGRAAASLSELVGARVILRVPHVEVFHVDAPPATGACLASDALASVQQSFDGEFAGQGVLVFPKDSALSLAALLTDQPFTEADDIDDECEGVLTEVGNILLNAVLGSMANMASRQLTYDLPVFAQSSPKAIFEEFAASSGDTQDARVLLVETSFDIRGKNISGQILVFCRVESLQRLLDAVLAAH